MADQLQEMLQRIYQDGVHKVKLEAREILNSAEKRAAELKQAAESEAKKIVEEAKKNAEEIRKNVQADIKMASSQALSALKQKVVSSLIVRAVDAPVAEGLSDIQFLQKLIIEICAKWNPDSALNITLPENHKAELETFFQKSSAGLFKGNLKIDYSPQFKNGMTISPGDGSFKISFTDEDFANFFKSYLRPKASQLLFGE